MRFAFFVLAVIFLTLDYLVRGGYSLPFLMYAFVEDTCHAVAWYFLKI